MGRATGKRGPDPRTPASKRDPSRLHRHQGPLKFQEPQQKLFLEHFAKTLNWQESSARAGVSYDAVNRLHRMSVEFAAQVAEAKRVFLERIETAFRERAIDGVEEARYDNKGKKVGTHKRYSDQLLIAYAKRHIKAYRDRMELEGEVAVKFPLDLRKMKPEERAMLRKLAEARMKQLDAGEAADEAPADPRSED